MKAAARGGAVLRTADDRFAALSPVRRVPVLVDGVLRQAVSNASSARKAARTGSASTCGGAPSTPAGW